ncbi:acyltransferase [Nonomuraea longicatena]|uniref:Acyltransferase n=1 Tax=Nonomuraea longicatena TaxID=83682 RepID=A0ABN1QG82_9ACTN
MSVLTDRITRQTPAARDRGVDALRALAIVGVVLGHWLVTAWEPGPWISSPLAHQPGLAPLSWVLQTLAVFFLVGGFAAARGLREPYGDWVRGRMRRLLLPAAGLLAFWAVLAVALLVVRRMSVPGVRALALPAVGPLWFLAVFALLTALTPLLVRLRYGVPLMLAVVAAADVGRFALGAPGWTTWVTTVAGWLVPYLLGMAWARGRVSRRHGVLMLAGGAAATAVLVGALGYPASMVGVTGQAVSNLSPPTLAAVTFGLAQCGLAVLVREPLARLMRHPPLWAAVALTNLAAMRIFLWHQTALVLVVVTFGLFARPDRIEWIWNRLAWLPVAALTLAAILWGLGSATRRIRRPRRP